MRVRGLENYIRDSAEGCGDSEASSFLAILTQLDPDRK